MNKPQITRITTIAVDPIGGGAIAIRQIPAADADTSYRKVMTLEHEGLAPSHTRERFDVYARSGTIFDQRGFSDVLNFIKQLEDE